MGHCANVEDMLTNCLVLIILGNYCLTEHYSMEGLIVGDEFGRTNRFPHAAFLAFDCKGSWICGASVLNHKILLTAAHCVAEFTKDCKTVASAGNSDLRKAPSYKGLKFKYHENYSEEELSFDLALTAVESLPLGDKIKRIVIPKHYPKNLKIAVVAGWGLIADQGSRVYTKKLKALDQTIRDFDLCESILGEMEDGTFCAGEIDNHDHRPSMGDSGSGLIYNKRIQIGLISYRVVERPGLMVYTNVTYFYPWIEQTTKAL